MPLVALPRSVAAGIRGIRLVRAFVLGIAGCMPSMTRRSALRLLGLGSVGVAAGCGNNDEQAGTVRSATTSRPAGASPETLPPLRQTPTTATSDAQPQSSELVQQVSAPTFVRTPDDRFDGLEGYAFAPNYLEVDGLRIHYLDEGEAVNGTMLLLHGEPTWSFLYRNMIPGLVAAGWRCIAPDMVGFGRSDKVTDPDWYSLDAHVGTLVSIIEQLDPGPMTMVCQDWAGPYGLVVATENPGWFDRLVILNTWLHHDGYEYPDFIKTFRELSQQPDYDIASVAAIDSEGFSVADPDTLLAGYTAPFHIDDAEVGAREWPAMLPFAEPDVGGADRQATVFDALATWTDPVHVIFGDNDPTFSIEWGQEFADHIDGATFSVIEDSGHFVQETGPRLVTRILDTIAGPASDEPPLLVETS